MPFGRIRSSREQLDQTSNSEIIWNIDDCLAGIQKIVIEEYGKKSKRLDRLYRDVTYLYGGKWKAYEKCQAAYHTIEHALEVALAAARMMGGWNRTHSKGESVSQALFEAGIAAALFHDTGYIKEKGDRAGKGGKFTFQHVERSKTIAYNYLYAKKWDETDIDLILRMIDITEFHQPVMPVTLSENAIENKVAYMVGTADLVAQMADVNYVEHLPALFEEFQEAYAFENEQELKKKGIRIYHSVKEIQEGTVAFFEDFVLPRLQTLERMDKYFIPFFDGNRDPYRECIVANVYRGIDQIAGNWPNVKNRLPKFNLMEFNVMQQELETRHGRGLTLNLHGAIKAIEETSRAQAEINPPGALAQESSQKFHSMLMALLQAEPDENISLLSRIGMLLSHIGYVPGGLVGIMETVASHIQCEAGSILVKQENSKSLIISLPIGAKKKQIQDFAMPWNKGIAGWVYNHRQPLIVQNVDYDDRFYSAADTRTGFQSRSLMTVPLSMGAEVVGVIEMINKEMLAAFDDKDITILYTVSRLIEMILWIIPQVKQQT